MFDIVRDLLILFAASTAIVVLFHFLKLPTLAGLILSGTLIGPFGFGWVSSLDRVHVLAEMGVVLLMFSLGLEFSLKKLVPMRREFFGMGGLQCFLTTLLIFVIARFFEINWKSALVLGLMIALSSTAIVLRILQQRRELQSPQGQTTVAILLFQDLLTILILVVIPFLSPLAEASPSSLALAISWALAKTLVFIIVLLTFGRHLLEWVLRKVVQTQMREAFLAALALLVLGTAVLSEQLGFSMALGAFLAGLLISDSDYGHQAVADVLPLRDLFLAVFFVSVGMILDVTFFLKNVHWVFLASSVIIVVKVFASATAASLLGRESRIAALVGLMLAQVGEFSFVIAEESHRYQILTSTQYQMILSVTFVLLLLTPQMIQWAPKIAPGLGFFDPFALHRLPLQKWISSRTSPSSSRASEKPELSNHVVIVGYGLNGKTLAQVLMTYKIPHAVIEVNQETVKKCREDGAHVIFGDASKIEILRAAGLERARAVVLVISDGDWIHQIVRSVRRLRPDVYLLVRTHYFRGVEELKASGASDLVVGEIEMGVEIFSRVLKQFGLPDSVIQESMKQLQDLHHQSLREFVSTNPNLRSLIGWMNDFEFLTVPLSERSSVVGRTVGELALKEKTGAMIAAVVRKDSGACLVDGSFQLQPGDLVYLVGSAEAVESAREIFG